MDSLTQIRLSRDLIDIDSTTGREGEAGACLARLLREAGHTHRNPPPEPTTCCERGCNGCVWEGYYGALAFWREDAAALMATTPESPGSR